MPVIGAQAPSPTSDRHTADGEPRRPRRTRSRLLRRSVPMLATCLALTAPTLVTASAAAGPAPLPPAPIRPAPVPPVVPDDPYTLLADRTYSSVAVIGGSIPGGGPLVVAFDETPRVGMDAGCNSHAGSVTASGDQLRIGRLASTMMACPPPRADADDWLARFTSVPLTWRVFGPILTLSSPLQTVVLIEEQS
ncbi:MAG: META domain-containing protein [Actinomycetota bacterium]|nr:META domain-containing protein [Actinomycetota bacterium]